MTLLLLILIPFGAAIASVFGRTRRAMETANLAGFGLAFVMALIVAGQVLSGSPVSLWGGFFYADALSALVCLLTASVSLVCAVYAVGYVRDDERNKVFEDATGGLWSYRKYYSLTPLFVSAMLLVTLANNLGVMWVAIEGTTLTSVFLVMFYGKVTSIEAAWKYAIIGGVGLSMALFGTLLAYYAGRNILGTDTLAGLNWSVLAAHAKDLDPTTMRLAFILALLGYGTKAGLAPMHTWKPDAYSEAPLPVTALLSSALLNCALYGLIRFYILASRCLGGDFPGALLLLLGILSMGLATPFILLQRNLRRLLAYSSIDQAGIMAIALGLGSKLGALALMLHMTYHTVTKSLLFLCAGNVYQHFKTDLFARVKGGVLRTMPVTGVVLLMAMLAVLGLPPFSMFQSEFLIVQAALGGGHYLTTVFFVLFGVAIFGGAIWHVGGMVLGTGEDESVVALRPWRDAAIAILAGVLILIAFWLPGPLLDLIRGAARVITGE